MNINKNNYEVFFIDYHDGNLSAEQAAELMLFLESNPGLKAEFESFNAIALDIPEEKFPSPDSLKRGEINEHNFSWYMTASVENDLSSSEQMLLNSYIKQHPAHVKDVELFRAAKLEAGNEIFPDKKSLKKPIPFVFNFNRTINYAVAAMLFLSLFAGGYFIYTKSSVQKGGGVAEIPVEKQIILPEAIDTSKSVNKGVLPNSDINVIPDQQPMANVVQPEKRRKINKEQQPEPVEQIIQQEIQEVVPQVAEVSPEKVVPEQILASVNQPEIQKQPVVSKNDDDEYVSVWEAIRNGAENNLRKAIAKEDDIASTDSPENKRIRIMDVVSKGVEKISNDKVSVDAAYADNGRVSGFRFAAGKFSIEKNKPE